MNLRGYIRALENLKKQMNKFLATKEFKTDVATQFYNEILKWKTEIEAKLNKLLVKFATRRPGDRQQPGTGRHL